jgi:hypothetical protein
MSSAINFRKKNKNRTVFIKDAASLRTVETTLLTSHLFKRSFSLLPKKSFVFCGCADHKNYRRLPSELAIIAPTPCRAILYHLSQEERSEKFTDFQNYESSCECFGGGESKKSLVPLLSMSANEHMFVLRSKSQVVPQMKSTPLVRDHGLSLPQSCLSTTTKTAVMQWNV